MSVPALVGPSLPRVDRILVIHVRGGLGDVLLSTVVLDALHRLYRNAKIDVMVEPRAAPLVRNHPAVHNVHLVSEVQLEDRRSFLSWVDKVRKLRYRVGIVLWNRMPEALLLRMAGVRFRVGSDSRLLYSWMYTHRVRVRSEHGDTDSHWVECQLDYARAIGADLDDPQPRLMVEEEGGAEADRVLRAHGFAEAGEPLVVLHVGRGTPRLEERMPAAPFARIADALCRTWKTRVLLTAAEEEKDAIAAVMTEMREKAVNLSGSLTLPQLIAVLGRAAVVVANDSGPMHMAAALGRPTVGIFAMERDLPKRWGPRGQGNQIVRPSAFRCSSGCLKETCPQMICYQDITPEMVLEATRRAVSEHAEAMS